MTPLVPRCATAYPLSLLWSWVCPGPSRAESPTTQSAGLQPCVAMEKAPRPKRSPASSEFRFARGTFSPHLIRHTHRAEALGITHIFLRRPSHNSPSLPAFSSRRSSFVMPLGGKLRFPGGGVFGSVCVDMRDAAATVGPGKCRVHLPTRPTRRHPRLGSGASLPSASRRRTFATRTWEAGLLCDGRRTKMCISLRAEALCFVRSGLQPGRRSKTFLNAPRKDVDKA